MMDKETIIKLLNDNSFELVVNYLIEERPQNTIEQTSSLLSLLAHHTVARNYLALSVVDFYLKKWKISTLQNMKGVIINYY